MQVNVQDAGAGTADVEVKIDEAQYHAMYEIVLSDAIKTVQVAGFRKGRAPRSIVERSVNLEGIRAQVIDRLIPDAYRDALAQTGLRPLTDPEVELVKTEDPADLRFHMIVHKMPEVKPCALDGLQLTQYVTAVSDDDVEAELKNLVESRAEYVYEPDAVLEDGDIAVVDIEVTRDGEPVPNSKTTDFEVTVGAYAKTPAIDDSLRGLKEGASRDIDVLYPPDFPTEELRNADTLWHVNVKEIRRRRLAVLSDEFANDVAGVETVDELRKSLRKQLESRASELDQFSLENQAIQQLVAGSAVEFPYILVDQEVESRQERLVRSLQRARHSLSSYAAAQGMTQEQLLDQLRVSSEADLTEYLVLNQIASDEGILVTSEDIDAQFEKEGAAKGKQPAIIEVEKKVESRRESVKLELLRKLVLERAISKAHVSRQEHSLTQSLNSSQEGDAASE